MTLFESDLVSATAAAGPGTPRADVVVRTPAPSSPPAATFLSVVVLAESEHEAVERDLAHLGAALSAQYPVFEIVLVISGSRGQLAWARGLAERQANLQVLGLVRGVRDEVAFTAGLDGALGDVVVTARLGADSPEDILRCAAMVNQETAVVVGVDSSGPAGRRLALRLTRALASSSMGEEIASVSLGLRGYSRAAMDAWLPRRDRDRVLRMLPSISGYKTAVLPYVSGPRGRSRPASSFRQVLRSIFYASGRPLRVAVGLALVASVINVFYALYVAAVGMFQGAVPGWTSMSLQMSFMFFLLSVVIAIMAEFMFQSNETANERPIYRVAFEATSSVLGARDMLNVEAEAAAVTVVRDDTRMAS